MRKQQQRFEKKIINKIKIKKATGVAGISSKIVENSKSVVAPQFTSLINLTIETGVFPNTGNTTPQEKQRPRQIKL